MLILGLSILDPDGKSHYNQHVFINQFLAREPKSTEKGLRVIDDTLD